MSFGFLALIKEDVNPLAKVVKEKYHTYIGQPKASSGTSWCASFVSWCLGELEFINPKSWSSQSGLPNKNGTNFLGRIVDNSF